MQAKLQKMVLWTGLMLFGGEASRAQVPAYDLDAAKLPGVAIQSIPEFSGTHPAGVRLSVNNRYFEKNGKPWYPIMGEFHYWRYPAEYWEEEIVKMKSGGLQIVATYIYWGAHEKTKGNWNWTGRLNLRRFIELCARHGMYVWLRPGPYINGDVRGRGFPDRIYEMRQKRSNHPAYLSETDAYFEQVGRQTRGMYWKEGGPVIGVQLENEYASGDSTHISQLKQLAIKNGISPVYWSVTANTVFRDETFEVLPMQGAYCYRGWEAGQQLTTDFLFSRDQWIMEKNLGQVYYDVERYPRATCEQGAGMQETHGSRISVAPHVIEAHAHNQTGRGVNFMGYFMFQGGTQYPGTEMKLSDGPMMPSGLVSYDYQAPIDEFGRLNDSYKYLKLQHLFLNDFGNRLVTMQTIRPATLPTVPEDTANLRYTGRFNGEGQGFIFLCNTQNYLAMPPKTLRMKVHLPDGPLTFPREPVTFTDGKIATWPVNFQFGGINVRYATAQVLCDISQEKEQTLFMYGTDGIDPEICIDRKGIDSMSATGCAYFNSESAAYFNPETLPATITIRKKTGSVQLSSYCRGKTLKMRGRRK
ncbi:beta-galactosidase [Chitinophaga pollutisoli]|uniref:Beta-galactosidase n=1 Tax=Chitinophaga pollutisoli TaxID=3133966 RepID=A0ABZ2YRQ6_9BACT